MRDMSSITFIPTVWQDWKCLAQTKPPFNVTNSSIHRPIMINIGPAMRNIRDHSLADAWSIVQ